MLWRGLGIDYEGGVLDGPARVAIHYSHRLGAYLTALVLMLAGRRCLAARPDPMITRTRREPRLLAP